MASLLSSNDRVSVHFENIHLSLSTAYFEALFHSMLSKHEHSKRYFYDVIRDGIYHWPN